MSKYILGRLDNDQDGDSTVDHDSQGDIRELESRPTIWSRITSRLHSRQPSTEIASVSKLSDLTKHALRDSGEYAQISPKAEIRNNPDPDSDWLKLDWNDILMICWDYLLLMMMLYTLLVLPLVMAFVDDSKPTFWTYLDYAVDIVFAIDLWVLTKKKQMSRWMLICYILGLFPFYFVADTLPESETAIAEFIHLMRLCKFLRLVRSSKLFQDLQDRRPPSYRRVTHMTIIQMRLLRLAFFVLAFTHMLAPGFIFVSNISERNYVTHFRPSWIASYPFSERADDLPLPLHQYCVAVYWFLTTLTTIGFGDVTPRNPLEQIYTIMMMLASAAAISYVTAIFSSIVNQLDNEKKEYIERMASLSSFIETHRLPQQLRIDLFRHFNNVWGSVEKKVEERYLLAEMPTALRNITTSYVYRDLIARTHVLNGKSKSFVSSIMMQAKLFQFKKGESIGHFGDTVNEWMMIAMGNISMMFPNSNFEIEVYEEGSSLGEIGIVLSDVWIADLKADGPVSVWAIPRPAIIELLKANVDFRRDFSQIAKQRFESFRRAMIQSKELDRKAERFLQANRRNSDHELSLHNISEYQVETHSRYIEMIDDLSTRVDHVLASDSGLSAMDWLNEPLCVGSLSKSGNASDQHQIKLLHDKIDGMNLCIRNLEQTIKALGRTPVQNHHLST